MTGWTCTQLTFGSDRGEGHAHSYYDIPVIDRAGRRVLTHRLPFSGRDPTPEDAIEIGLADVDDPGRWTPLGKSRAWSWQQGPLAQWVGGGPWATWADRDPHGRLVGRLMQVETGEARALPRPLYCVTPDGRTGLALDMGRIDALRPGYGFVETQSVPTVRAPDDEGVWRVDLATGGAERILSIARAVAFLMSRLGPLERLRHRARRFHYWFNHAKISPDGTRFTVKLRWKRPRGHWDDRQGVSLTCGLDGQGLSLLARATSHVIWMDESRLHLWRRGAIVEVEDRSPEGREIGPFAGGVIGVNAHLRRLAGERFVWDTPYSETVTLNEIDRITGQSTEIARFTGHVPPRGPYRCDLHPCPSADGRCVIVTSPMDGARQVYALTRTGA